MTLLRHRANGHRPSLKPLLEPAGENTVTPQALADLIAKSVCKEIKSAREEICAAAIPALSQAANVILPQLAQAASARGESLVTAAETAFVAKAEQVFRIVNEGCRMLADYGETVRATAAHNQSVIDAQFDDWRRQFTQIVDNLNAQTQGVRESLKTASHESLVALIAAEVDKYQLAEMIRAEVRSAALVGLKG
jgi:hypothetical protein